MASRSWPVSHGQSLMVGRVDVVEPPQRLVYCRSSGLLVRLMLQYTPTYTEQHSETVGNG